MADCETNSLKHDDSVIIIDFTPKKVKNIPIIDLFSDESDCDVTVVDRIQKLNVSVTVTNENNNSSSNNNNNNSSSNNDPSVESMDYIPLISTPIAPNVLTKANGGVTSPRATVAERTKAGRKLRLQQKRKGLLEFKRNERRHNRKKIRQMKLLSLCNQVFAPLPLDQSTRLLVGMPTVPPLLAQTTRSSAGIRPIPQPLLRIPHFQQPNTYLPQMTVHQPQFRPPQICPPPSPFSLLQTTAYKTAVPISYTDNVPKFSLVPLNPIPNFPVRPINNPPEPNTSLIENRENTIDNYSFKLPKTAELPKTKNNCTNQAYTQGLDQSTRLLLGLQVPQSNSPERLPNLTRTIEQVVEKNKSPTTGSTSGSSMLVTINNSDSNSKEFETEDRDVVFVSDPHAPNKAVKKVNSPVRNKPITRAWTKANTPTGKMASPPAGRKANAPAGKKANTPAGKKANTPKGRKANTPAGRKANTPAGKKANTPAGRKANTPAGRKANLPAGGKASPAAGKRTRKRLMSPANNVAKKMRMSRWDQPKNWQPPFHGPLARPHHPIVNDPGNCRLRPIAIDGSNVAYSHGKHKMFSCLGIKICINYFLKRGHETVKAFVPQFRRNKSADCTDRCILEELSRGVQNVVFTPSRAVRNKMVCSYDDRLILDYASETGAVVVSNDNYRDLINENLAYRDTVENRLLMFTFVDDVFLIPQDPMGRFGPNLDRFLQFPA